MELCVKNLCDNVLKIKNMSWQFRWIFRRLCHGVLYFFCKYFFHGEIFKRKWQLFILLGEFWYFEIKETLWLKISVTKFQKSKIWADSFVGFSVGFVVVYFNFSVDAVFMEKFAKQNDHFSTFWTIFKKDQKVNFEWRISPPRKRPHFFYLSLSSRPVREDCFGLLNFYQGLMMGIFINDLF